MRIRSIKPEFFLHEGLFEAERETLLPLRLAFAGLWCAADREGRFKWEPRKLGIQILPYDNLDFSRVLDALATRGFIVRYTFTTDVFGVIPTFSRHQVLNNRERASELPQPPPLAESDASTTRQSRVPHASQEEGKGMEGNKEGKGEEVTRAQKADFQTSPEPEAASNPEPSAAFTAPLIEFPVGFPTSEAQAIGYVSGSGIVMGVPDAFVSQAWNQAVSRDFKDGAGRKIANFAHWIKFRWSNEVEDWNRKQAQKSEPEKKGGVAISTPKPKHPLDIEPAFDWRSIAYALAETREWEIGDLTETSWRSLDIHGTTYRQAILEEHQNRQTQNA